MNKTIQVNVPYNMLLEKLDFILEKELNPEIYFDGEALDNCRERDLLTIGRALKEKQRTITMHAPFMDLSPGGVDTKIKKATIERLNQTIELANFFQPRMIVFHPGYNKWFFDGNVDMWLDNSIKTWKSLVMKAEQMGVSLALENIFEEEPSSLEKLITSIHSPCFNFCFDTGHFNLFSTTTMEDWFDRLGYYLKEVHVHDNLKKSDDHLPIGDGNLDFDLFFNLIRKYDIDPIYTIEPHQIEHLERSLQLCKHYLTQIP